MKKQPLDFAATLMRKAQGDLRSAGKLLEEGLVDTGSFHLQQAAEKALKAILTAAEIPYPYSHDLGDLLALAAVRFPELHKYAGTLPNYSDFAVSVRYDDAGVPSPEEAKEALLEVIRLCTEAGSILTRIQTAD